jgi:hypothetical protein
VQELGESKMMYELNKKSVKAETKLSNIRQCRPLTRKVSANGITHNGSQLGVLIHVVILEVFSQRCGGRHDVKGSASL